MNKALPVRSSWPVPVRLHALETPVRIVTTTTSIRKLKQDNKTLLRLYARLTGTSLLQGVISFSSGLGPSVPSLQFVPFGSMCFEPWKLMPGLCHGSKALETCLMVYVSNAECSPCTELKNHMFFHFSIARFATYLSKTVLALMT